MRRLIGYERRDQQDSNIPGHRDQGATCRRRRDRRVRAALPGERGRGDGALRRRTADPQVVADLTADAG